MTRLELMEELRNKSADRFLEEHLFDRIPHIFQGNRPQYIVWKRIFANRLQVDPACLTIVGTAAVGWSLNPEKNFKPFDGRSDVDVAIISPYHFVEAWRFLRTDQSKRLKADAKTLNAWNEHTSNYIYWGTIAADKLLGILPFGLDWMRSIGEMTKVDPTRGRTIKMRIYNDFESLRSYQTLGAKTTREKLLAGEI